MSSEDYSNEQTVDDPSSLDDNEHSGSTTTSSEISEEDLAKGLNMLKEVLRVLSEKGVEATNIVERGQKLVRQLKSWQSAKLYCTLFHVAVLNISPGKSKYPCGPSKKESLEVFIANIKKISDTSEGWFVLRLWDEMEKAKFTLSFVDYCGIKHTCLYSDLLFQCFSYLRYAEADKLHFIMDSSKKCLQALGKYPGNAGTVEAINMVLLQLVKPISEQCKVFSQSLLRACSYDVTHAIMELLLPVLNRGSPSSVNHPISEYVFDALLELVLVDKCLVVGTINSVEKCLIDRNHPDRLKGLKFLLCLFTEDRIPGQPNPSELFGLLWHQLLIQSAVLSKLEIQVIAEQSPRILFKQPNLQEVWCSVLLQLLKKELRKDCEQLLIQSMTVTLLKDVSLIVSSEAIRSMFVKLLTHFNEFELLGPSRAFLLGQLSLVFEKWIDISDSEGVRSVLSCILSTCKGTDPQNTDWFILRQIFINHLLRLNVDVRIRVQRLLKLHLVCEVEDELVLHELYHRASEVRQYIYHFLQSLQLEEGSRERDIQLRKWMHKISSIMVHPAVALHLYFNGPFLRSLRGNPQIAEKISQTLNTEISSQNRKEICKELKMMLPVLKTQKLKAVTDCLLLHLEEPIDEEFFQVLLEEVQLVLLNQGVIQELEIDTSTAFHGAFKLISSVLHVVPYLGFKMDFVKQLIEWVKFGAIPRYGALQCFIEMARHHALAMWNLDYTISNLERVWSLIIKNGTSSVAKLAIQCISLHLEEERVTIFKNVLKVVKERLHSMMPVAQEHGLSILGYLAKECGELAPLKSHISRLAIAEILDSLLTKQVPLIPASSDNESQWCTWDELRLPVRVVVVGLKALGRCTRYCSTPAEVRRVLQGLTGFLVGRFDTTLQHLSVAEISVIKLEAACAILTIYENFHTTDYMHDIACLSQFFSTASFDAMRILAKKLQKGLTPYKTFSQCDGRGKGNLPSVFLGLLGLITFYLTGEGENAELLAMLCHVFHSRRANSLQYTWGRTPQTVSELYKNSPFLLVEHVLAYSVYLLPLHRLLHVSEPGSQDIHSYKLDEDSLFQAGRCLLLLTEALSHINAFYELRVSRLKVLEMATRIRQTVKRCRDSDERFKVHLAMCDLLLDVVDIHYPRECRLSVEIILPSALFSSEPQNDIRTVLASQVTKSCHEKLVQLSREIKTREWDEGDREGEEEEGDDDDEEEKDINQDNGGIPTCVEEPEGSSPEFQAFEATTALTSSTPINRRSRKLPRSRIMSIE